MMQALKALFQGPQEESAEAQQYRIRLAAAALLIETARADFNEDLREIQRLENLLQTALRLEPEEVHELVIRAREQVEEATSLYEFTRVINDHCSAEQKRQLIRGMWAVAYTDGDLDKYEEHLIRQVAELVYVPHSDYIQCKLAAQRLVSRAPERSSGP